MGFVDRLSNGWKLSMSSFSVIRKHKKLLVFPILSGLSLVLVMGSFLLVFFASMGWNIENIDPERNGTNYLFIFIYYLVNYFVIVFFNMALVHCARLYFNGEEPSVSAGLAFSMSKIGAIFSWAVFAATVGTILRAIQENSGTIGRIITGIIGIVWSIATFFVVPVIAYENLGPIDAFKRSSEIMRNKWGERIGAGFSFVVVQILALLLIVVPLFFLGSLINFFAGLILAVLGALLISAVMSAAKTIFISAVYHKINNMPVKDFDDETLDGLFYQK